MHEDLEYHLIQNTNVGDLYHPTSLSLNQNGIEINQNGIEIVEIVSSVHIKVCSYNIYSSTSFSEKGQPFIVTKQNLLRFLNSRKYYLVNPSITIDT